MVSEKMTGNIRVVRSKHPEPILTDDEVFDCIHKHGMSVQTLGLWAYINYLAEMGTKDFTVEDLNRILDQDVTKHYHELVALDFIAE